MTENVNSIIVTHNARLRCFITKLYNNSNQQNPELDDQIRKFRWQNCCVLKLVLKPDDTGAKQFSFNLSLLYSGAIDKNENKPGYQYWKVDSQFSAVSGGFSMNPFKLLKSNKAPMDYHIFPGLDGTIDLNNLRDIDNFSNLPVPSNTTYTFYLVRHGQAEHNTYSKTTIWRTRDTHLTEKGKGVVPELAGNAINNDLINGQLDYFFASDLIRTRETFAALLSGMSKNKLTKNNTDTINIVILPCSHELAFVPNGNCDSTTNTSQPFTYENKMSCSKFNKYDDPQSQQYADCVQFTANPIDDTGFSHTSITVNIVWDAYMNFYGNKPRGVYITGSKQRCRETSMIEQSIKYINEQNEYRTDINSYLDTDNSATNTMQEPSELLEPVQPLPETEPEPPLEQSPSVTEQPPSPEVEQPLSETTTDQSPSVAEPTSTEQTGGVFSPSVRKLTKRRRRLGKRKKQTKKQHKRKTNKPKKRSQRKTKKG